MKKDPILDSNRFYQALGKIIIEFQFIEYMISDVLANLIKLKESNDTYRILAAMSYKQKVDMVLDLYSSRKPDNWSDINIPISRQALYTAEEFRNKIVHSFWHVNISNTKEMNWMRTKASLKGSKGLIVSIQQVNLDDLEKSSRLLYIIRDWYLGQSDKLNIATLELKNLSEQLNKN